jgi:hypothetical protein
MRHMAFRDYTISVLKFPIDLFLLANTAVCLGFPKSTAP